ncbi:MAG: extracellular solute-binding protein [Thermoanaerobaculia bacterium]
MPSAGRHFKKLLPLAVLALAGCGGGLPEESGAGTSPLVVYSGRGESLVGPLLDQFEQESGVEIEVRYGGTSELAATLLEEGDNSPADVFLSQDAAALGALSAAGRLRALDEELLVSVPRRYRSARDDWVGLSGRARTVVYEPSRISESELPASLEALGGPEYRGRFGVAPTNGSFQAHMAVYRVVAGAEALEDLLGSIVANEPQRYPKNSAIVEGVIAGEIDFGLVNHYYLWRAKQEDPSVTAKNYVMTGRGSSFVNASGVGVISNRPEARTLVAFLLSEASQSYFSERTYEYPLIGTVLPSVDLAPLAEVDSTEVDFTAASAGLEETLGAIDRSGLIR